MYACMYLSMYLNLCKYVSMHFDIYIPMQLCIYIYIDLRYFFIHACMHVWNLHI